MPTPPTETADPTTGPVYRCRRPLAGDGPAMRELAEACRLDRNSHYAYVMWGEYFAASSTVAVDGDDDVVGFVTGFRVPGDERTLFVWQIGVSPRCRRRGVAAQMLDHLVERTGVRCVEATVTPSNDASAALFRALAARHGTTADEAPLFAGELLGGHEPEVRFRISVAG